MEKAAEWVETFAGIGGAALPAVFAIGAVALAAAIYEFFVGARRAVIPPSARMHIFEHLKNGRFREALNHAQDKNAPFTNIVKAALRLPADTPSFITYSAVEDALYREITPLRSRVMLLQGLGLLSLLAGFAGALGGMYRGLSSGGIQTGATMARSVSEALPAALAGLSFAIAILALAFLFQMRLAGNEAALTGDASRLAAYLLGPKYVEAAFPGEGAASRLPEAAGGELIEETPPEAKPKEGEESAPAEAG